MLDNERRGRRREVLEETDEEMDRRARRKEERVLLWRSLVCVRECSIWKKDQEWMTSRKEFETA